MRVLTALKLGILVVIAIELETLGRCVQPT